VGLCRELSTLKSLPRAPESWGFHSLLSSLFPDTDTLSTVSSLLVILKIGCEWSYLHASGFPPSFLTTYTSYTEKCLESRVRLTVHPDPGTCSEVLW
jgi:hypothetical protein